MTKLLFDADMFAFRAASSAEVEINWYGDLWTLHSDLADAKAKFDDMVATITDLVLDHHKVEGQFEIVMCLSDRERNFRKEILPTYKFNREGKRKPTAYWALVEWIKENYTTKIMDGLEADDVIGILSTEPNANAIVISGDKDMRSLPVRLYDFFHNEYHEISLEQADHWHRYQTLVGDITDNYKGCPKVGEKKAEEILSKDDSWAAVVAAYSKAGLPESEALTQARVARILRYSDYDFDKGCPILWTP